MLTLIKYAQMYRKKYGILRKIRRYISEETAILIYKVMIRPHFDYGDYMIDSSTQKNIILRNCMYVENGIC